MIIKLSSIAFVTRLLGIVIILLGTSYLVVFYLGKFQWRSVLSIYERISAGYSLIAVGAVVEAIGFWLVHYCIEWVQKLLNILANDQYISYILVAIIFVLAEYKNSLVTKANNNAMMGEIVLTIKSRHQERLDLMKKLHQIEKCHETIVNLSSNDPQLIQIQNITKLKRKRPRYVANEMTEIQRDMVENQICVYLARGMSTKDIADELEISIYWIRRVAKKIGITIRKAFKYRVLSKTGLEIYTHSRESILKFFGWGYHSVNNLSDYIDQGYIVENCSVIWSEVPAGAQYILNQGGKHNFVLKVKM